MPGDQDELADIDYNSKEVFETSDYEDPVELSEASSSHSRRSSIEVLETSHEDSRDIFEKKIIDNAKADFSDKISNPNSTSYQLYTTPETPEQKLTRIRAELEELSILEHAAEPSYNKIQGDEIQALLEQVKNSLSLSVPSSHADKVLFDLNKVEYSVKENVTEIPVSKMIDLETRVSRLEKVVGVSNSLEQHDKFTIQSLINDLYRKLNILSNPDYSKTEVRPLIDRLNRANGRQDGRERSILPSDVLATDSIDDNNAKILYDKVLSLPNFESVLPQLLNKLKSLNTLNVELTKGVTKVSDYQNQIFTIESSFNEWRDYLKSFEIKLDEFEAKSEINKHEINNWVVDLQNKSNILQEQDKGQ